MSDVAPAASPGAARFAVPALTLVAIAGAAVAIWYLADLLMLVFGSIVLAVLLRSIASVISDHTPLPENVAFAGAIALCLVLVIGATLTAGSQIGGQMAQLVSKVPEAWSAVEKELQQHQFGQLILDGAQRLLDGKTVPSMYGFATTAFGGLGDALVVLVLAILVGANPGLYKRGLLALIPRAGCDRVADALDAAGRALRGWLLGRVIGMAIVGVLTGLGLWMLGVPMALGLGFLAAVLDFVPFFGPILAAVPAVLIASGQGWALAAYTALLFLVVQNLEGYLFEPMIEKWAVHLPPALTVLAVVIFGFLFGIPGIVFATPLMVVTFVLVRKLYVQWALGKAPG
ncbi:AI-2E family transporter [Desertibaculum subflavum]|uniref:AI-2E family transporter n=1 Tax=Desertibaculum subflavum TaxID=2268458 RepID=UPI000E66FB43